MARIPKQLKSIIALLILGIVFWIFKNLALVIAIILLLITLIFIYFGFRKYFITNTWTRQKRNKVNIIFLLLAFIPLYFFLYISFNYEQSNKILQEKSISGLTEIGKAAIMLRKPKIYIPKIIKKEARKDFIEQNENGTGKIIDEIKVGTGGLDLKVNY